MSTKNLYKKNGRHKAGKSSAILIGPGQTAYVNSRFLSESERHSWHDWKLQFGAIDFEKSFDFETIVSWLLFESIIVLVTILLNGLKYHQRIENPNW